LGGRKFWDGAGSEPEEPLDAGNVGLGHVRTTVEPAGALAGLLLHGVAAVGLLAHPLAGPGLPATLGGALVGLPLRHDRLFLTWFFPNAPVGPRVSGRGASGGLSVSAGRTIRCSGPRPWSPAPSRGSWRHGGAPRPWSCCGRPAWRRSRRTRTR